MKFALIENIKKEATKGAAGICPTCGAVVIAKCGEMKINHWAHKGVLNCDPWWEYETSWHRTWKDNFPAQWQESIATDELTGEKHIADVRTVHELVIEFQHSFIDPDERKKREGFYIRMVWIVDGTRLKRDYGRFVKAAKHFRGTIRQGIFIVDFPEECFPTNWLESSVPVIFDFKGTEIIEDPKHPKNALYFLYPKTNERERGVAIVSRDVLIQGLIKGELFNQQQNPQKEITKSAKKIITGGPLRPSQYVNDRGRLIRRPRRL
jgi:competence protein CoiA